MDALYPAYPPTLRRIAALLVLPLLCGGLPAARAAADEGQAGWSVRGWRSDSGLPDDEDYDIKQSADGCIWVATSQGVFRFDGNRFTAVSPPEVSRDYSSIVYNLCPARDGSVWWTLNHGRVVRWQQGHATVWQTAQGMPNDFPCSMCEGRNGAMFIGFRKAGVAEIANGKVAVFTAANGIPDQTRGCLASDSEGNVWCGANNVLLEFRDGAFVRVADIPDYGSEDVEVAPNGGFWLRGLHDVRHFVPGKGVDQSIQVPDALGAVSAFHDDGTNLWIGTLQSPQCGLFRVEGGKLIPEGLERRQVTSIFSDREGNLWLTTFEDGIKRLRPREIRFLKVDPGAQTWGRIRAFARDTAGAVWAVFEDNSVYRQAGGQLEQVPQFSQDAKATGSVLI